MKNGGMKNGKVTDGREGGCVRRGVRKPAKRAAPEMINYFRGEIAEGRIPTFSGAAARMGCSCSALLRACREREVFSEAYAECRMLLVDYLIEGGLTKRLDGTLVKLMLAELGRTEVGGLGAYACGEAPAESAGSGVEITLKVLSDTPSEP